MFQKTSLTFLAITRECIVGLS